MAITILNIIVLGRRYLRPANRSAPRTAAILGAAALLILVASACAQQQGGPKAGVAETTSGGSSERGPEEIAIQEPGLYPEGVEWDGERHRFLVSSAARGSVTMVRDGGFHRTFVSGEGITNSLGTHIDRSRDRLLVAGADFAAVGDTSVQGEAQLAVYDLASGKRLHLVDLAGLRPQDRHLANDVTVDPEGNAYVTDSLSPVIYKVTPEGKASVLVADTRLKSKGGELGLNGITLLRGGYLLVAMFSEGKLYRVPLGNPEGMKEVRLPQPISADGLALRPDGNLVVAAPFKQAVLELSSDDGWRSAQIVGRDSTSKEALTTNTAFRAGDIYAVSSHIGQLGSKPPVGTFEIFRADLD